MVSHPFLGVALHSMGGLAAGSFYIPFRKVKRWAWESYWLIQGVLAWVVMPSLVAFFTVPDLWAVLCGTQPKIIAWVYLLGVLWGIGGLTFGLSMRYLGMSLGYSVALGFCAAFGTLVPAIAHGKFLGMFTGLSGRTILDGIAICLTGIAICGYAGIRKERELTDKQKKETIREFSLLKGFAVAIFAGVMSACMALAFDAGEPIAEAARNAGAKIFANNPIFIIAMAGGFTTNFVWCIILNVKNRSLGDYVTGSAGLLASNYILAGMAGVIWYGQFFFYGMGTTQMGREYGFSSWTIHMAFIIVFSNLWGLHFREWKGVTAWTRMLVWIGIMVLILSTMVIGLGNYLAPKRPEKTPDQTVDTPDPSREQSVGPAVPAALKSLS
ncbi:MAG: L-rhamnose/proton symporter RhaT [Planctomycetota bacterium]|jgi:L-rhamnose-H+ transport protein